MEVRFDELLLEHVSFELAATDKVAIVGGNGTGKTNASPGSLSAPESGNRGCSGYGCGLFIPDAGRNDGRAAVCVGSHGTGEVWKKRMKRQLIF